MDEKTLAEWEALANAAKKAREAYDAHQQVAVGAYGQESTDPLVPAVRDWRQAREALAQPDILLALVAEVRRMRELLAAIESDAMLRADIRDAARAALGRDAQGRGGYRTKAEEERDRLREAARSAIGRFDSEAPEGLPKPERGGSLAWAMASDLRVALGLKPDDRLPWPTASAADYKNDPPEEGGGSGGPRYMPRRDD